MPRTTPTRSRILALALVSLGCFGQLGFGAELEVIIQARELVETKLKLRRADEKKATSKLKKLKKPWARLLSQVAKLEEAYAGNERRLADAEQMPAVNTETRAQKDASIRAFGLKKAKLTKDLEAYEQSATKLTVLLAELRVPLKGADSARAALQAELRAASFELACHAREARGPLSTGGEPRRGVKLTATTSEIESLRSQLAELDARPSSKLELHGMADKAAWLLLDLKHKRSYALALREGTVYVFGEHRNEKREAKLLSEARRQAVTARTITGDLGKSKASLGKLQSLTKPLASFLERQKKRS
jgi:hypothetical protein